MPDPGGQGGNGPIQSDFVGDPEMKQLLELFLRELPVRIETIRAAQASGDAHTLTRIAHQLRGACAGYGFPTLGSAAGHIEDRLRALSAEGDPAPLALARIGAEVNALVDMCRRACAA